jgi:two-component system sensor histidine kinase ArlS
MPVRIRITLLFAILAVIILGIVCGEIYYFSYSKRISTIKTRLTNRAITTARLLYQREIFHQSLVQQIDSLTTLSLKNKIVQAYDNQNKKIYDYSDVPGDSIPVPPGIFNNEKTEESHFFSFGTKEAVAYQYYHGEAKITVVSAGEDVDGKENLKSLRNILLISFLVGTAFVMVTGYIFSTRLLLPIKKITTDVEDISAQNLTRRINTGKSKDEWFSLANTLNQLLNRLQESFELQGRFISNASHELSTPLTSISSQLEVALQKERHAAEYKAVLNSIYQDVRHMSKLTRTLLEFAKASGNAGGLKIDLIRIDEIIMTMPAEMVKINSDFSVSLQFEKLPETEESLLVFGNEDLLFLAIKNIVLNACKYSMNHQAVILLKVEEKRLLVTVSDNGLGISESDLNNIFQPFFRVEDNIASEGFGLGLSLTDRIVKLHKGVIEVVSQPGIGTSFSIILPSARVLG